MHRPLTRRQRFMRAIMRMKNLRAYYPTGEVEGTVARNYARATIGTLNGTIAGATLAQSAKYGLAYSLDGVNDKVTCGLWSSATTNIVMGAIFKSNDYTKNGQTIMSNGIGTNGTGRGYSIVLSGNATTDGSLMLLDHSVKWLDTTYNIQDNNPHFIMLVLNSAGNPTVYVDGVSVYSPGSNTFATPNGNGSLIGEGGDLSFPRWAKGTIQDVFLANQTPAATDIKELTNILGFT